MLKEKKKYICFGILGIALLMNSGCRTRTATPTKSQPAQKTVVTMMYTLRLNHFEELVEKTYPDIDLQIEDNTTATINGDSERRLRNGHGTDLVVTTMPTGEVQNYVLDLSAEDFVDKYQATAMGPIMIEGQSRYLPLPGQYSGYVLNQTLMEQLGKTMPSSNDELLSLLDAGKDRGLGIGEDGAMFGIITVDPAAVGSYIIGTQVPDFLGQMDGIEWMGGFQKGTAGFEGEWDESLNMLQAFVDRGYLNSRALTLKASNVTPVEGRMLDGTMLIGYGNVRLLTLLNDKSSEYEFVMLPFLSDEGNPSWVISAPDAYLAINKELDGEGKEELRDACVRIVSLLSTQEGQDAWIADTSATTSYLTGCQTTGATVPPGLADCVEGGYIYNLQMPSSVIQYFGRTMILVLDGATEIGEGLASVDDYCQNGSGEVDYDQSLVGSVTENLLYVGYNTRLEETAIGNLVADAAAEYAGTDIAVINGGSIRASLYAGDVTGADLNAVCPYENRIITVETTGKVIWEMLENGISQTIREENIPGGRFLQVSGLHYSYEPMMKDKPAKLLSVTLADGTELDSESYYSIAISDYMAGVSGYLDNNGDGYVMLNLYSDTAPRAENVKILKETGSNYTEALRSYFYNHRDEPIDARLEGRIVVVKGEE